MHMRNWLPHLIFHSLHEALRQKAFAAEGDLDASSFKSYQKKFTSYAQLLSNATARLAECHSEECVKLSCLFWQYNTQQHTLVRPR